MSTDQDHHASPVAIEKTILRLRAVVSSFIPAASLTLIVSALGHGNGALGLLGAVILGVATGFTIAKRITQSMHHQRDLRLPYVLSLLFLPMATFWLEPNLLNLLDSSWQWTLYLLGIVAILLAGVCMGLSLRISLQSEISRMSLVWWGGLGICLGILVAIGPVMVQELLHGSFLATLFAAPLIWAAHPKIVPRSFAVRMLLTLAVVLSAIFLLLL